MNTDFSFDSSLFEEELELDQNRQSVRVTSQTPTVRTTARVTPRTAESRRDYLTRPPESWTWDDLRNYVVSKIEERDRGTDVQLPAREEGKEFGIFSAFAGRHDEMAGPIAVFAFETSSTPGYWRNAPIHIGRFTTKSDPYFADQIKARLKQA